MGIEGKVCLVDSHRLFVESKFLGGLYSAATESTFVSARKGARFMVPQRQR